MLLGCTWTDIQGHGMSSQSIHQRSSVSGSIGQDWDKLQVKVSAHFLVCVDPGHCNNLSVKGSVCSGLYLVKVCVQAASAYACTFIL